MSAKNQLQLEVKIIAVIFGFTGLILFISGFGYLSYQNTVLSFFQTPPKYESSVIHQIAPISISIPDLKINLPVTESVIVNGIWQTSSTGASHLSASASPGQGGNIIIYGHNIYNIFGKLTQIKPGNNIIVTTDDHKIHLYRVDLIKTVSPDDIELVMPTVKEALTIFTCTGFLDSRRFIVRAHPILLAP